MSAKGVPQVALRAQKYKIPFLLVVLRGIHTGIKNHGNLFTNPTVDLVIFLAQITALADAQQAMKGWPRGSAATRDAARDAAYTSAELLRAYVQSLCDASPEQAAQLAQAAGMSLRSTGSRNQATLRAVQLVGGIVKLAARASALTQKGGSRFFNWQYSLDGGKTWVAAPSTNKSKTTIAGLPSLTLIRFRVNVTNSKAGTGEWSHEITFTLT